MRKAVVLLSGGLDSATCLYWAKSRGFKPSALVFDYGQTHRKEIRNAVRVAKISRTPFQIVRFSLPWGGSALLDREKSLPKGRKVNEMVHGGIPATYVPARNTVFLSLALSYADSAGAEAIVIGANAVDFSGYPDCRPRYIEAMQEVARLGTRKSGIKILAPLIRKSKSEIIAMGGRLGVPYELTWSCYQGGALPCGRCDSCILRAKGFNEAGTADPAITNRRVHP